MLTLIAFTSFATVALTVLALSSRPPNPARERARALGLDESAVPIAPAERPIAHRFLRPLADAAMRLLPHQWLRRLEAMLVAAGEPVDLGMFVLFWAVCAAGGIVVGVTRLGPRGAILLGLLGLFGPFWWLRRRVRWRQRRITTQLPDAIDLLVTCVEAGLGLDAALVRVAEATDEPLGEEIARTVREIAVGRPRHDALLDLGVRTGVRDLIGFVRPIVQAERSGVSIATALRVQADDLRVRRRQRAEEAARKIPVKMVIVTAIFFIPATLIVTVAPAIAAIFGAVSKIG
jgi:tight adherence protein C